MMPETPNAFDEFDSVGMVLAFLAKTDGFEAVQAAIEGAKLNSDELSDAAAELRDVGLHKLAGFIEEAAQSAPEPEPLVCPFDPDSANGRDWRRRHNVPPKWWGKSNRNS
jgi:hypothetical protein